MISVCLHSAIITNGRARNMKRTARARKKRPPLSGSRAARDFLSEERLSACFSLPPHEWNRPAVRAVRMIIWFCIQVQSLSCLVNVHSFTESIDAWCCQDFEDANLVCYLKILGSETLIFWDPQTLRLRDSKTLRLRGLSLMIKRGHGALVQ